MKWITRSHIHVERVAVPWLISRFIDPYAEFLFVPEKEVLDVAKETGAIPFDTPGATLHHRGDLCTFDVAIEYFGLTDKALQRMAKIINAADAGQMDSDPLATGLEASAVRYGQKYPNDLENIKMQFKVYDDLYSWCQMDVALNNHEGTNNDA